MRTFQFQMPPFLIETCLTLRFTFSEVSPKIGPNSVLELSINLIEALSTDKLTLIVKLVNLFTERPRLNFGEIG